MYNVPVLENNGEVAEIVLGPISGRFDALQVPDEDKLITQVQPEFALGLDE